VAVSHLPPGPRTDGILFTAFEPSGDDHASSAIAEIRRRRPELPIYAWGGSNMEAAGATLIGRTGQKAVMGLPGPAKIAEHFALQRDIRTWLGKGLARVHVPVDSPAANFPICKLTRPAGMTVIHLVAPQMWAWGAWRVKKLRRLTNKVLCLLPFEEDWFLQRGVPARFIGHPLFDVPLDEATLAELDERAKAFDPASGPPPSPRIALMPGSRPAELRSAFPRLLDAFQRLLKDFPAIAGVVAATTPRVAEGLRARADALGGWPERLAMSVGDTDAAIRWCDFALVVSGTVTLQIARQQKPMASFYCPNRVTYHLLARWLVETEHYTLPNLIMGKRIVPELIPYMRNDGEDLALEVIKFMRRTGYAEDQKAELRRLCKRFEGTHAASAAADEILRAHDAAVSAGPPRVTAAAAT
jgi:lipid-A-disaccharide synthase